MFKRKPSPPKPSINEVMDDMACAAAFAKRGELPQWAKVTAVVFGVGVLLTTIVAAWRGSLWGFPRTVFALVAAGFSLPWFCG